MAERCPDSDPGPMSSLTIAAARRLAEATPGDRNRTVDLLRAVSILVVVFGHWLMVAPFMVEGALQVTSLVDESRVAQAATWILQVMPVFFFVGGYANARGWRAARRQATPYAAWLRHRLRRLVLPTLPLLILWAAVGLLTTRWGIDPDLIAVASQAALVPTWFLGAYVAIVAMTPITIAAWDHLGWMLLVALTGTAAVIDLVSLESGVGWASWLNYVFVWNAVHLLGYAWADGRVGGVRSRLTISALGFTLASALVALGPYPLAMVGLDNAAVANSNPPRLTLIALGLFQFGLVLSFEEPIRRWLDDLGNWTRVVAINGSIMSLYLWHLTVMVGLLAVSMALGGVGLASMPGSGTWWLTRPLWLAVLLAATLPVLALVGRFERPTTVTGPAPSAWRQVVAVAGVSAGLGLLAGNGVIGAEGINVAGVSLPLLGVVFGGIICAPRLGSTRFGRSQTNMWQP